LQTKKEKHGNKSNNKSSIKIWLRHEIYSLLTTDYARRSADIIFHMWRISLHSASQALLMMSQK